MTGAAPVRVVRVARARANGALPASFERDARLARMDAHARAALVAASGALAADGVAPSVPPDARSAVVLGSARGCRESFLAHAAALAAGEVPSPSVFARTVHNAFVAGIAMAWGLGGAGEAVVSGETAGIEALLLGRRLLDRGRADLVVSGGADEEAAAILLLRRADSGARLGSGGAFFETDPAVAARRADAALPRDGWIVVPDSRGPSFFAALAALRPGERVERRPAAEAAGADAAARAAEAVAAGETDRATALARDPAGGVAWIAFES